MIRRKSTGSERIFGTDGIRAKAGEYPLDPSTIQKIGCSAGRLFKKIKMKHSRSKRSGNVRIVVGKDTRSSGDWIEESLSQGLAMSGCKVFSCGVIPTSAISAILRHEPFSGGAVISASHNPVEFNGIKFFSSDGKKIPDSLERKIESNLKSPLPIDSADALSFSSGIYHEARPYYMRFLKETLPSSFSLKGMRWVLDCANGAASGIAVRVFKSLGAEVFTIHDEPSGSNINLKCGALHPEDLQAEVKRLEADGGCAFDGDADRVQFVDEKGRLMDGDVLLFMAAQHLKKGRGLKKNCVVTTVMANLGFFKEMKKLGVKVITTPVGDRAVSDALRSSGAILGGEQSGHIIFGKFLPTGDGILTALQILNALKSMGKTLSFFSDGFQKFPQVLVNLRVKEKVPVQKMPELRKAIRMSESELGREGRILVRYSGTEPLLRIMVEGDSEQKINDIARKIQDSVKKLGA